MTTSEAPAGAVAEAVPGDAEPDAGRPLGRAALAGSAWSTVGYALNKGSLLVSTIVVARLVTPDEFGLVALGLVVLGYVEVLSELGIGTAVVASRDGSRRVADVAFALALATGAAATVLGILTAPAVAAALGEPRATPFLRALSLAYLGASAFTVHNALLVRSLQFRRRAVPEVGRSLVKGGVSIALAATGLGAWSLVWGHLSGVVTGACLTWVVSRWRPRRAWDRDLARSLVRSGAALTGVSLSGIVLRNVDYLVVGRRLGTEALGVYTLAYRLPELVVMNLCAQVGQALLPVYVRLARGGRASDGFVPTWRALSAITVPAGVGLAFVAPEVIAVLFGDQWTGAVPVLRALACYAVLYALVYPIGDLYKATGRTGVLNLIGAKNVVLAVPVLWWAAGRDLETVAWSQVGLAAVILLIDLVVAVRTTGVAPGQLGRALLPVAVAAGAMAVVLAGGRAVLDPLPEVVRLVGLTTAGAAAYVAALWAVDRTWVRSVVAQVAPRSHRP